MTTHQQGGVPAFELRHRLARALEHAGLKPEDMAVELGLGVTTIRNYLHDRTTPRRAVLLAWALRCGVPFEWLAEGTLPGPSPQDGGSINGESSSACTRFPQVSHHKPGPLDGRRTTERKVAA